MQLSKVLSLAFVAVAMATVNGTNSRTANSTIAKAPVAKQMSPAEIMAKIDALDADNAAYHAAMDATIDTTSPPDAPPTHGRPAASVHIDEMMEDYKTEYEKEELLAMLPNATSAQVVEVEDVTVVNVNNGTNSTNSTTGGQPATTATVVNQGARLDNGRAVGASNGTNSTSGALPPPGPRANGAVGIQPVYGNALLGAFAAAMVYIV
ncbi:hypothetical protein FPQ18DRAFT_389614 [Pyronema domesticum]|uniref:Uncharacterized protein n=1 Tax=Pyronema omphalodes (strain CBS 100304) TaxID=1076935 RepID=U4LH90_PYROM|nr:hypothetical protein FPQ18DRAFT_389614 [Pyronema domesticum]CCX30882.1 Protein of unknown function [Pyronema omphalodes CBS 100304]